MFGELNVTSKLDRTRAESRATTERIKEGLHEIRQTKWPRRSRSDRVDALVQDICDRLFPNLDDTKADDAAAIQADYDAIYGDMAIVWKDFDEAVRVENTDNDLITQGGNDE